MKIKKIGALLLSAVLCICMAAPAFAYSGEEVDVSVLPEEDEELVTVTDSVTGALTPEGNLTLVDDYYVNYSDGSGQQFITLVSKSGNTFYLVIDRNSKGTQTVHFMNLVDESDLLTLMEEEDAESYLDQKEAAEKVALEQQQAEEAAKKAAEAVTQEPAPAPKEDTVTKVSGMVLGAVVITGLAAGGGFCFYQKQKQKKQSEKEALDPDADYTEDKGDFEIPIEDTEENG